MIIKHVENTMGQTISRMTLWNIRQRLKKESAMWYSQLREGQYEYLHEFRERINEIMDLQKKTHEIIDNNENNPQIQLAAISELHKLNITLSNYFDVAPAIGITLSATPESKPTEERKNFIV